MYDIYSLRDNNFSYKKRFFFEEKLIIETYLIGYKIQGESILFFIRTDGNISFSGIVDCFCIAKNNKVKEILKKNNVDKLDFICWTHPDYDHSKGLKDIINNYASEETNIWIPESVDTEDVTCSKEVQELFAFLKNCTINSDSQYNVYSVSDRKDMMFYDSVCFQKDTNEYPLEITSYAPNSQIIRKQHYMDEFIKNDRSIFFVLALGNVRIFSTGDVEDATLERIPSSYFKNNVHIMKIPHHGSKTSTKMLDLGWDECDIACSTVYRSGGSDLPLPNVMNEYSKLTQHLICTGKSDKNDETEKYGVVKIETDVLAHTFSIHLDGNATYWNNQTNEDDKLDSI